MVIRGTSEFDLRVKIYYDCKDTPLFVSRIQSIKEALRRMGGFTVQKRRTVSGRIILSLQSRADHWSESQGKLHEGEKDRKCTAGFRGE